MKNQMQSRPHILRNLIIFAAAALGIGWLGIAADIAVEAADPQQGFGMLLWIVVPTATGLILRAFGGDGWKDSGIKPNFKNGWGWYLAAPGIFLAAFLPMFGLGRIFNAFSIPGFQTRGVVDFISLTAAAFFPLIVKNIFEEFAWRGYLTARFEALKIHPMFNHLLTGAIWGTWHIPYWLYFADRAEVLKFSTLEIRAFILLGLFNLIVTAVTYGELRLLGKSVWMTIVLHSTANAVTQTLLLNGFIKLNGGMGILFSPGNDGILSSILFGLIGVGLYLYRVRKTRREAAAAQGGRDVPEINVIHDCRNLTGDCP
ncbi:MAG: CPBP family intramembrane glutamic endopeptidase [Anaerolineales bacterium]